ncbi:hypothetical protein CYMTET_42608 [Cymbomonas tetramitiformis]|uniref:Uncharacterized protein n=1 Tax=Cymbomonas tetramitiformis TaxID=36881 RepID=A0AAE0C551_9CHLO|nr:hypothetical protein CYMTET_42608 [Cymbomonas tetramitiformis]
MTIQCTDSQGVSTLTANASENIERETESSRPNGLLMLACPCTPMCNEFLTVHRACNTKPPQNGYDIVEYKGEEVISVLSSRRQRDNFTV